VSQVLDADLLGFPELASYGPHYDDAKRLEAVQGFARALGSCPFVRRTGLPLKVAERVALGKPVSRRNVTQ
jgi:hypothetical protein